MTYFNLVEGAGLKMTIVDVDVYAWARAVQFSLGPWPADRPLMVLDLHPLKSQWAILSHHEIIFYRTFAFTTLAERDAALKKEWQLCSLQHRQLLLNNLFIVDRGEEDAALLNMMQQEFRIEPALFRPFDKFIFSAALSFNQGDYLTAAGLALRGAS